MRQQLSLFPQPIKQSKIKILEPFQSEDQDVVRLDPEYEKTLSPTVRYHPEYYGLIGTCSSRVGDWAEHKVQCIALTLGLEVYANISCVGLADLVINSNNNLYMIDVKVAERSKSGNGKVKWAQGSTSDIRWDEGVYGVCLIPAETGIYCRWYNSQKGNRLTPIYPPGLKDLWLPSLPSSYRSVA